MPKVEKIRIKAMGSTAVVHKEGSNALRFHLMGVEGSLRRVWSRFGGWQWHVDGLRLARGMAPLVLPASIQVMGFTKVEDAIHRAYEYAAHHMAKGKK